MSRQQAQIVVNPSNHRVAALEKKPIPVNTRTCLFHPSKPEIFVEGVGETDADKIASVKEIIEAKLKLGYVRERLHGQHPHSFDEGRIAHQKDLAEKGDKDAQAALDAKGGKSAPKEEKTAEELELDLQLLQHQIAQRKAAEKAAKHASKA